MDHSTPGFPIHHQLLELAQTLVHWVIDAIQPSHPLSSPFPTLNLSQHQGLFQWVSSSHQVVKLLEFQLQHHSFQWKFRTDFLQDWLVWSPCSPRDSQESSPTPQFKSINSLMFRFLYWRRKWQPTLVFLPGEPCEWRNLGGLPSMGLHRVGHNWNDLACMYALEKEIATHPSILAWRIPGTEEPGGLPSIGSHRVGHYWGDLAAAAGFFIVQLSHPYMTTRKTIALTRPTFVSKVMSQLF